MSIDRKRVTLHPLKEDGTIDESTNLYPKTFLDGIVDREGNEVEVALAEDVTTLEEEMNTKIPIPTNQHGVSSYSNTTDYYKIGDTYYKNFNLNGYQVTVSASDEPQSGEAYSFEMYVVSTETGSEMNVYWDTSGGVKSREQMFPTDLTTVVYVREQYHNFELLNVEAYKNGKTFWIRGIRPDTFTLFEVTIDLNDSAWRYDVRRGRPIPDRVN
jgi:hypothetical protein